MYIFKRYTYTTYLYASRGLLLYGKRYLYYNFNINIILQCSYRQSHSLLGLGACDCLYASYEVSYTHL